MWFVKKDILESDCRSKIVYLWDSFSEENYVMLMILKLSNENEHKYASATESAAAFMGTKMWGGRRQSALGGALLFGRLFWSTRPTDSAPGWGAGPCAPTEREGCHAAAGNPLPRASQSAWAHPEPPSSLTSTFS